MIPYIEILALNSAKTALAPSALVEPSECWFEMSYYDIGQFEIYAPATAANLTALQKGNFAKIPQKPYLWFITSIEYSFNADGARMVSAKGYEAKWLLKKRAILSPLALPSELGAAVYALVNGAIGQGAGEVRKVKNFQTTNTALGVTISETQATRGELAEFVNTLLKTYGCGSRVTYSGGNIVFSAFAGADKSDTVIFSQSFDNLISSTFFTSDDEKKNYCQVVSTQSTTENGVTTTEESVVEYPAAAQQATGIDRDEMTLASNISTKYIDGNGQEQETPFGSALYKGWQTEEGKNTLAEHITAIDFEGEIDLAHSGYVFGVDFFLGDQVAIRDEYFGISAKARVTKYTFKQDANGYGEEAEYGNE